MIENKGRLNATNLLSKFLVKNERPLAKARKRKGNTEMNPFDFFAALARFASLREVF